MNDEIKSVIATLQGTVTTLETSIAARQAALDADNAQISADQIDAANQTATIVADKSAVDDINATIAQLMALLPSGS